MPQDLLIGLLAQIYHKLGEHDDVAHQEYGGRRTVSYCGLSSCILATTVQLLEKVAAGDLHSLIGLVELTG